MTTVHHSACMHHSGAARHLHLGSRKQDSEWLQLFNFSTCSVELHDRSTGMLIFIMLCVNGLQSTQNRSDGDSDVLQGCCRPNK